eukprot:scaffold118764_cov48-Phaeocystis_antarctica.AAC.1
MGIGEKQARLGKGGRAGRAELTDQPVSQLEASCRRSRAPSTSPVITDSCDESLTLSSDGSPQPLTLESIIARWKSIAHRGPCIDLHR